MATAEEALALWRTFEGEPGNRFWDWYAAPYGTPWCDISQSYVLTHIGIDTHFAWVSAHFDNYRNRGHFTSTNIRDAKPGDLVAFEWGSTPGGYDHIAMIDELTATGAWSWNGNVNGSRVRRLWFPFDGGGMAEIARPFYSEPIAPPPSTKGKKLFQFSLTTDNRIVLFGIGYGCVTHRWQGVPNGGFGTWAALHDGQPFTVTNLTVSRNADGRFDIMAWDDSGKTCYRTQDKPNGAWRAWRLEL